MLLGSALGSTAASDCGFCNLLRLLQGCWAGCDAFQLLLHIYLLLQLKACLPTAQHSVLSIYIGSWVRMITLRPINYTQTMWQLHKQ